METLGSGTGNVLGRWGAVDPSTVGSGGSPIPAGELAGPLATGLTEGRVEGTTADSAGPAVRNERAGPAA